MKQKARDEEATLAALPPLASLQAWVHRPQAVAKCTVGDVFAMRVLGAGDGRVGRGDGESDSWYPCTVRQFGAARGLAEDVYAGI